MAPTSSLRACMSAFKADASRGIRIVMQSAGETSVRALCRRATGPFHIVALGDSVMWGQGLSWNKFARQVASTIESALFYRDVQEPHIFAHSGATLRQYVWDKENLNPPPPGELPLGYPSIPRQLELAVNSLDPKEVELVLLNGGINDVGAFHILDPDPTVGPDWVRSETRRVMERMKTFLPTVLEKFTKAKVVIPNYFQIISTDTDLTKLALLMFVAFGLAGPLVTAVLRNKLDKQSEAFNQEWTSQMNSIIEDLHTTRPELEPERICLLDVQFGGTNAYGAPDSNLWEISQIGGHIVTQDQVEDERIGDCEDAKNHLWGPDLPKWPYPYCGEAAAFHPNLSGASQYGYSIMNCIRNRGWLEEWRGGPWIPTYKEMTASMDPPRDTPQERLGLWTGKIIARELQPPHYPVRGRVEIINPDGTRRWVQTDAEFSVGSWARGVIIDKEPYIQDDRVNVYAPYTRTFGLLTGGTHPMDP
jgi:lysophospholipase L1-like esterase